MARKLYLILIDIRSTHNVGSMLRTADGLGISEVFICGYTPYPMTTADERPPYLAQQITKRIAKTALGAEKSQPFSYHSDYLKLINGLKDKGVLILALEQARNAVKLSSFKAPPNQDIALIAGNETEGLDVEVLNNSDYVVELLMEGKKESFNVSVAAAMALFYLRNML